MSIRRRERVGRRAEAEIRRVVPVLAVVARLVGRAAREVGDLVRRPAGIRQEAVSQLEERGLLDRTLIVLASEFSRDMLTEGKPDNKVKDQVEVPDVMTELKHYGMHRHFTDAGCVLMFGGGTRKAYLHGKTADERPCKTLEKRVIIEDLHATIYRAMGISPKYNYVIEKRPFYVTRDGLGVPITEIIA